MTTGAWTRLREVALFGPSSLFWFNSLLFIPLLSQPHLILLRAKKTPLFWGELTQANRSTLKPVTKALFQSHVITHQCHTTHTFQMGRVALWACGGKLSTLWMQDTVIWIKSPPDTWELGKTFHYCESRQSQAKHVLKWLLPARIYFLNGRLSRKMYGVVIHAKHHGTVNRMLFQQNVLTVII